MGNSTQAGDMQPTEASAGRIDADKLAGPAIDLAQALREIDRLERWRGEEKAKHLRVKEASKGFAVGLARANATIRAMKNQNRLKRIGVFDAIFAAEHTAKITNQRKEIARLTDALAERDATIDHLTAANMVLLERISDKDLTNYLTELAKTMMRLTSERDEGVAALMWVYDRITVDSGMTKNETDRTAAEIRKALRGEKSDATAYKPELWHQSPARALLAGKAGGCRHHLHNPGNPARAIRC